ncbi:hypothetical protein EYD10_10814 [Varanus komodoensis]|nr:hypothetical protein EYD10_10814 [Varanus komodoensis]
MYGCESWTIRKAEHRRIEAFEFWCWRRLLRVLWTARRSNWSVLEEINPDCSLEGQILKMKCKYFGHLMRRKDSLEKSLMLGTIEGKRRKGRQRMRWLDGVTEAGHYFLKFFGHCSDLDREMKKCLKKEYEEKRAKNFRQHEEWLKKWKNPEL